MVICTSGSIYASKTHWTDSINSQKMSLVLLKATATEMRIKAIWTTGMPKEMIRKGRDVNQGGSKDRVRGRGVAVAVTVQVE